MDKIEFLRKGREKYEILVVTRHVQGESVKGAEERRCFGIFFFA